MSEESRAAIDKAVQILGELLDSDDVYVRIATAEAIMNLVNRASD